ncbi:MAG: response regulator [Nitrospinales bacterium]
MPNKIRVLLADDHAVLREGLKLILSETPDIIAAEEAGTGMEVLNIIRNSPVDVVVLDITMPEMNGLDILKQLKIEFPNLAVLVLSMFPEERGAIRFLKAGASGYLCKSGASDQLVKAIKTVYRGEKYFSPSLAQKMALALLDSDQPPHELLSDREYQVMCMLGSGKTVSEVAQELKLSIKTISTHRAHILEKMKIENNAQLMRYAIENKLID